MDSKNSCNSLKKSESGNHGRVIKKIEEIFIREAEEPIGSDSFEAEPLAIKFEENEDFVKEEFDDDEYYSAANLNENINYINPSCSNYEQSLQGRNLAKPCSDSSMEDLSSSHQNCSSSNFEEIPLQDEKPSIKLSNNSIVHVAEKPSRSTDCNNRFSRKNNLKKQTRIQNNENLLVCSHCDKIFLYQSDLNGHLRSHTGEKPFACTICDKKFSQKSNLNTHLKNHAGEKPFACTICDKKLSHKSSLNTHLKNHAGEKPFVCTICDKKFSQKCVLDVHLRTHTSEKPFFCPICDKKFSQKNSLDIHLRSHTSEKQFICSHCEKKFSRKSNLKRHLKNHTTSKMSFVSSS